MADGAMEYWARAIRECREANRHLYNRRRPVRVGDVLVELYYCAHCGKPNNGRPISLNDYAGNGGARYSREARKRDDARDERSLSGSRPDSYEKPSA